MTDQGDYYSDTTNPFASFAEARGRGWGVFVIGTDEPLVKGLTEAEADYRVRLARSDPAALTG